MDDEHVVKWFLEQGAEIGPSAQSSNSSASLVLNTDSSSYLDRAASVSSIATFDLLIGRCAKRDNCLPLHYAAGAGSDGERLPMMVHLIELGYDVNADDEIRMRRSIGTPLHNAIIARSLVKVEFLLQKGADAHKRAGRSGSAYKMAETMHLEEYVVLMKRSSELITAESDVKPRYEGAAQR